MTGPRATATLLGGAALLLAAMHGCSVVNDFGEVVPAPGEGGSPSTLTVTSSGGEGGAAGGGGKGGKGGVGGSAGGGGSVPLPAGVVAVGGKFLGQETLYALDRESGSTLSQEFLKVAALAHDGAHDVFYVFEADKLPVKPGDRGRMTGRSYDTAAKAWKIVSTIVNIPLPRDPHELAMLRHRLAYLVDGQTGPELVQLDIYEPASVQLVLPESVDVAPLDPSHDLLGMVATRAPFEAAGGLLSLVYRVPGQGGCTLETRQVVVEGQTITKDPDTTKVGGTFPCASTPGFASDDRANLQVFVVPAKDGKSATLHRVDASTKTQHDQYALDLVASPASLRVALATCEQIAFVAEASQRVTALPLGAGVSSSAPLDHPLDFLLFEPGEQRALGGYVAGDKLALSAFDIAGICPEPKVVKLVEEAWLPPLFLEPRAIATRRQDPDACPTECLLGGE